MARSKDHQASDSAIEKPTRRATNADPKVQTKDSSTEQQPETSTKSNHHVHLPHLPHLHLHHDGKPKPTSTAVGSSKSSTRQPTKPPSAHTKFLPSHPKTSTSSTSTAATSHTPNRPNPLRRQTSVKTRYMTMLLDLDTIPRLHNILASFFTWILLAGYITFPGTFTSLSNSTSNPDVPDSGAAEDVLKNVKNAPLLWIAGFCCGIGAVGMGWLWWRWRRNFVWLINRIFLPGTLNSLAGLISTLVNVYSQQNRTWSISAKVTAVVSGICMVILAILFALYNFWILRRIKRKHGKEMRDSERLGPDGEEEGMLEKVQRKVMEPALEPGSVVRYLRFP